MNSSKKQILVTGAAGMIGRSFSRLYSDMYALRLMDKRDIEGAPEGSDVVIGDIADTDAVARAMEGVDAVVHLAGDASPFASWESALHNNIVGLHTLFETALRHGVRRVVYASSGHACGGHVYEFGSAGPDAPVRPDSLYGVSKIFGEALGRYYWDRMGLSTICLRIGACSGPPDREALQQHFRRVLQRDMLFPYNTWQRLSIWISRRDMSQLLMRSIEADVGYGIFYGTSDNHPVALDISATKQALGYCPEDSTEEILGEAYGPAVSAEQAKQ